MSSLSIIIPTHRRPEILKKCLEYLEKQSIAGQLEVIVISDDGGETINQVNKSAYQIDLKIIEISPVHQGTARNRGTEKAGADYILFIGDDIFLQEKACEYHLQSLNIKSDKEFAVLGFTTWNPALNITPAMRWLEKSGWQFGYPKIVKYDQFFLPPKIQPQFSYTSHISLPRKVALANPFCEDVSLYGWEDIEWGTRLMESGVRLLYQSRAKAWHHHYLDLGQSLERMKTLGRSVVEISRQRPDFKPCPLGFKLFLYRLAAMVPTMAGRHRKAFLEGIKHQRGHPCPRW